MKCSSLFQEVQSLRKEIDDLNHKLELAVRGRPSSGDLSSEAVLFMVEKQMQGMTLFDTAKLQALLANTLTLENLDSINMEAAEGEKKLMELYESLNWTINYNSLNINFIICLWSMVYINDLTSVYSYFCIFTILLLYLLIYTKLPVFIIFTYLSVLFKRHVLTVYYYLLMINRIIQYCVSSVYIYSCIISSYFYSLHIYQNYSNSSLFQYFAQHGSLNLFPETNWE